MNNRYKHIIGVKMVTLNLINIMDNRLPIYFPDP